MCFIITQHSSAFLYELSVAAKFLLLTTVWFFQQKCKIWKLFFAFFWINFLVLSRKKCRVRRKESIVYWGESWKKFTFQLKKFPPHCLLIRAIKGGEGSWRNWLLPPPKNKLQPTGQNRGRVFNSWSGRLHVAHLCRCEVKQPSLKLKTRPEQLLGSLPLDVVLRDVTLDTLWPL